MLSVVADRVGWIEARWHSLAEGNNPTSTALAAPRYSVFNIEALALTNGGCQLTKPMHTDRRKLIGYGAMVIYGG